MNSQKTYSLSATFYDLLILRLLGYEVAANYFVDQLPLSDGIEVLDAGVGTELYSFAILKKFSNAKITAFDLNEELLGKFREKIKQKGLTNKIDIFIGDILSPIPKNKQFDLIITGGVLEHVDLNKAVGNLSQYLKSGGYFLNAGVRNNFFGKTAGKFWGLKNLFSKDEIIHAFTQNGYFMVKYIKLPLKYFLIRLAKEAYIFKKL